MKLRRRTVVVLTAVLVGVLVAMWVVDTAIAARSERLLSQRVAEHSHLGFAPEAYFGGLPFVTNFITGVVPSMYVSVTDVNVKPFGLLRTHTTITDVEVSTDQLLAGDVAGAKAALITRGVNFDAVSLGRPMGITDLDISNPYDISPAGSAASEVKLTGTPPGFTGPVTVVAELRLKGKMFLLSPITVTDRSKLDDTQNDKLSDADIFRAFRWELDTTTLPLSKQASYVSADGGTVYFESQQRNVVVSMDDLAPVSDD
jgi:hypothetical protein